MTANAMTFPMMMAAKREKQEHDFPAAARLCRLFYLKNEDLIRIRDGITKEIQTGLKADSHTRSSIPCKLSYAQDIPTGRERGRFLALEMWPTNCRVMLVKFSHEKDIYMSSRCFILPHTVVAGRAVDLFNFLADNIVSFVKEKKVEKENLPMGIAFAFPLNKLALDVGILVSWSWGYGAQGVIGKDVVQMLRDAIAKHKDVSISIMGIIREAIGSLIALAWAQPNCKMGLIVGTGTNSAYVEQIDNCELFEGDTNKPFMLINTEWGNFGAQGQLDFVRNEFDKMVDSQTHNQGQNYYEKLVSVQFLGELVRLLIVRLMEQGEIFSEHNLDYIGIRWKMEMKSLIAIETDPPGEYTRCQEVMDKFRMRNCKTRDLAMVRYLCETVVGRSARLISCGVSSLINKMSYDNISIAVDGGVYRLHPVYGMVLRSYTELLVEPELKFEYVIGEDSAGVGASIMAGLAFINSLADARQYIMAET